MLYVADTVVTIRSYCADVCTRICWPRGLSHGRRSQQRRGRMVDRMIQVSQRLYGTLGRKVVDHVHQPTDPASDELALQRQEPVLESQTRGRVGQQHDREDGMPQQRAEQQLGEIERKAAHLLLEAKEHNLIGAVVVRGIQLAVSLEVLQRRHHVASPLRRHPELVAAARWNADTECAAGAGAGAGATVAAQSNGLGLGLGARASKVLQQLEDAPLERVNVVLVARGRRTEEPARAATESQSQVQMASFTHSLDVVHCDMLFDVAILIEAERERQSERVIESE